MSFIPQKENVRKYKKAFIVVFVLLNIYGLLCGVIYFFQENLIFLPTILSQEHSFVMDSPFEEVTLKAEDGALLNGLHFKVENSRGTILYFHGNAGNLQRWGQLTEFFVEMNYSVIVMDYRGYGKSTGKKSMEKLYADSELWYSYAKQEYSENEIIVYGRSLGTTFATYLASHNQPKNLILESPFYSIEEVAKSRFPFLPIKSLLHYKFPTYQYINKVSCPITIYHGTKDSVINYKQGEKLFNSIEKENKSLISVPNGGHNDLVSFDGYLNTIEEVLEKKLEEFL